MSQPSATVFADTFSELRETALRVKAERDEAVLLLREVLFWQTLGNEGPLKTRVRAFLSKVSQ